MDLIKVMLVGVGCLILGVIGGFAARSLLAGVVVGLFVFIGWILWRWFKSQEKNIEPEESKEEKKD